MSDTTQGDHRSRSRLRVRAVAASLALALAAVVGVSAQPTSALAEDYATWEQVEAARSDVAAAAALSQQIKAQIAQLAADLAAAQAEVERAGNEFQAADTAYQIKNIETATLQGQADEAHATAETSQVRAGQMAAQLARNGSGDVSMNLFAQGEDAGNLLYGLEMTQRISAQAAGIQTKAEQDRNNAQALTDSAEIARAELEELRVIAEQLFQQAQAASAAVQVAYDNQQQRGRELEAQLLVLENRSTATQASYQRGEDERIRLENERIAREAAEAAEAIKNGTVSSSGWAKPAGGYISSVFGYSAGYGGYHKGIDLASGCGNPIYAGSAGVVIFAAEGYNQGYGNQVMIDHGGGVVTRYGHIRNGGILVSHGQGVGSGQQIAEIGTTGNSTGCHLHYEVSVYGNLTNPYSFMQDRGITLG